MLHFVIRVLVLGVAIAATPAASYGEASPEAGSVDELRRQLQERDAIIADLLRRVEALEPQAAGDAAAAPATRPGPDPEDRGVILDYLSAYDDQDVPRS